MTKQKGLENIANGNNSTNLSRRNFLVGAGSLGLMAACSTLPEEANAQSIEYLSPTRFRITPPRGPSYRGVEIGNNGVLINNRYRATHLTPQDLPYRTLNDIRRDPLVYDVTSGNGSRSSETGVNTGGINTGGGNSGGGNSGGGSGN